MINETTLSRSIRLICLGGMTLGMHAAYAQEAAAEAAPQRIEVTGSRIPSLSIDGPSPVTVISAKDIKIDGARSVEDLLNNLPQVFADQGSAISNGASGTATVSLRGLGADRTLVLVNGRRLPSGSVNSSAADLNEIPTALIKRVDVLTGGAGAVYGAGAVPRPYAVVAPTLQRRILKNNRSCRKCDMSGFFSSAKKRLIPNSLHRSREIW